MQRIEKKELIEIERIYLKINDIERTITLQNESLESNEADPVSYVKFSEMYSSRDILLKEYVRQISTICEMEEMFNEWVLAHIDLYAGLKPKNEMGEAYNRERIRVIEGTIKHWRDVLKGDKVPVMIDYIYTPEIREELGQVFLQDT